MSLMGMNRAFKKHGALLGGIGALMMLVVAVSGLGANLFHGGGPAAPSESTGSAEQPVARVGDMSIVRGQLDAQINQQFAQMGMPAPNAADMDKYRLLVLGRYKQQAALALAAKAAGITVSDDEMNREREKQWQMQRVEILPKLDLDSKATDGDIDKALAAHGSRLTVQTLKQEIAPDDAVRLSVEQQSLAALAKKQNKVTEDQVKNSYDEIKVRHILINFGAGSQPEAAAKAQAQKLLDQIKADPNKMPELAKQFSGDPGSKNNGGLYDWTPASQDVPAFSQAAIAAGVGKVYPDLVRVVQPNYSGFHIIKSEGVRQGKDFPKDWDKNKQKYIDEYIDQQSKATMMTMVSEQEPKVTMTILDPGMKAAQALQDADKLTDQNAKNAKLNEALADLNQIKPSDYASTQAPQRRALILTQLKRPKDAIAAYLDAVNFHNSIETRLTLAELYQSQNDKPNALKQVQEAAKLSAPDPETEDRIATLFANLEDAAAATKARSTAADMRKTQKAIADADAAEAKAKADAEARAKAAASTQPSVTMLPPGTSASLPGVPGTTAAPGAVPATAASAAPASPAASAVAPPAKPAVAPSAAPSAK